MQRKKALYVIFFFVFLVILFSMLFVPWRDQEKKQEPSTQKEDKKYIRVYLSKKNEVIRLPLESYIEGVVAAEMPSNFHLEALKAQSLAARTYIAKRLFNEDRLDPKEWGDRAKNADVSDTVLHQAFLTNQTLQELWGRDYKWKMGRIQQAVRQTEGKVITYYKEPIYAAFFSTSNGWTEDSEDYFQAQYPYLRSVPSSLDYQSPKYLQHKRLTYSQLANALKRKTRKQIPIHSSVRGDRWIRVLERTDGKRIAKIIIGDQVFTGRQVREALQLSSTDFTWKVGQESVLFTTKGYGHGVGMSQWGAHLMAMQGKKTEEIINHYYQDVQISKWNWSITQLAKNKR